MVDMVECSDESLMDSVIDVSWWLSGLIVVIMMVFVAVLLCGCIVRRDAVLLQLIL